MIKSRTFSYENSVMVLLALAFGFVFFDRLALNFLAPFVVPELNLTNTAWRIGGVSGIDLGSLRIPGRGAF